MNKLYSMYGKEIYEILVDIKTDIKILKRQIVEIKSTIEKNDYEKNC